MRCCATILGAVLACIACGEQKSTSGKPAEKPAGDTGAASGTAVREAPERGDTEPPHAAAFDLHGRAGFHRVNVWERPDMDSPLLGYLRKGTEVAVGDIATTSESCPKGWFELEDGGYACRGRGLLVGKKRPFLRNPPPAPLLDAVDPYPHGFIRRDFTPAYKRLPSREEMWKPPVRYVPGTYTVAVPAALAPGIAADTEAADGTDTAETPAVVSVQITVDEQGALVLPDGLQFQKDDEGEWILPEGVQIPQEEIPHVDPDAPADTSQGAVVGVDYHAYARRHFKAVRQLLQRGFWISVARRLRDEATKEFYYQTVKGDFVPANAVHLVRPTPAVGYRVFGDSPLPAVIVRSRYAAYYQVRNGRFVGIGPADRLTSYHVREQREYRGSTYYRIDDHRWLKDDHVAFFPLRTEPPPGASDSEKWIFVDLSRQTLEAYEGMTPVLVTLISSGVAGDPETETPTGVFHVQFKHVTDDMAGEVGDGAEVYQVDDVPYVQYIHNNIALHAAFWHNQFGRPKSHGCINLSPRDARFLFAWTDPPLPAGWHGISAGPRRPGTVVIIAGKTPE